MMESSSVKGRLLQLGYMLGISLIIAGIIYFFAANWQQFDRFTKVILSISIMLLFYVLSYLFAKIFCQHSFLSRLLLFAGCFSFGISVMLVGQIYNSHANSYVLFTVWFFAALFFSLVTRYQPLYVLSYVLLNLATWFYFFPNGGVGLISDGYVFGVFLLMITINITAFVLVEKQIIISPHMKYISFITSHVFLLMFSFRYFLEDFVWITNLLYIAILIAGIYYFIKISLEKSYLILMFFATTIYLLIKYAEVITEHFGVPIFILTIFVGMLAVYLNVYLVKKITNYENKNYVENDHLNNQANDKADNQVSKQAYNKYIIWQDVITALFTVLASVLITVSLTFLITETIAGFDELAKLFFFMGILLFLFPGVLMNRYNEIIGGTMISIGYLMSSIAIISIGNWYLLLWVIAIAIGLIKISNSRIRILLFLMFHIVAMFKLFDTLNEFDFVCLIMLVVNIILIFLSYFKKEAFTKDILATSIYQNSFFYALLMMFILTFIEKTVFGYGVYILYNLIFFVSTTYLIFWSEKHHKTFEYRVSLLMWFFFLIYKYYDLVWTLLHKSLALIILGAIFMGITISLERKGLLSVTTSERQNFWDNKTLIIFILIISQILFVGVQVAMSERALASGTPVKLELQPVDPRSLMQGDYVILNYTISSLNQAPWGSDWENRWDKDLTPGQKVKLVLKSDNNGVYQYKEMYIGQNITSNEVIINGKYNGITILFGIESYFVPEGTGLELERNVKYAHARIASNGNAILEKLAASY